MGEGWGWKETSCRKQEDKQIIEYESECKAYGKPNLELQSPGDNTDNEATEALLQR